jgi:hypothetical protein
VIERLRDAFAPRRAVNRDAGYRRLLSWAALPVTDRRWAAPLSAVALGFGLFAGVAIGPSAAGTLATAPFQVIEMPSLAADEDEGEEEESFAEAPESGGGFGEGDESPAFAPMASVEAGAFETAGEKPAGKGAEPQDGEEPAEPEGQVLAGTVVHVNPAAGSYTVAEAGGVMSAVHAGKLPPAGAQVEVPIRVLANGTLAEAGKRMKTGTKARAKLSGIVTYVGADPAAPAYALSNRGTSVLVRIHPDPSGALPPLPALGAYGSAAVDVEAAKPAASSAVPAESPPATEPVSPAEAQPTQPTAAEAATPAAPSGCAPDPAVPAPAPIRAKGTLWQRDISAPGAPFAHADFEGIVAAVCPATAQLLLSADDIREAGHDLLFAVPTEIDTSGLAIADSVLAGADIAADGTLSLTGLANDERTKGADDDKATQGDLVPVKEKGEG